MKLAIVGSRDFEDKRVFLECLDQFKREYPEEIECIISGGAKGADSLAKWYAEFYHITFIVHEARWKVQNDEGKWVNDRNAGLKRNQLIIDDATHVLAFPSKTGTGTQHTMNLAKRARKPVVHFYID